MIHRSVSVFCASSNKVDEVYFDAARKLGLELVHHGIAANYGGGAMGLMGVLADTMIQAGGSIRGIIPRFMVDQGWHHPALEDLIIVEDMHERKKKLAESVDAFIALPGGVGTLEELLEMMTHKQLGQVLAPIIILNINHFFDPFLDLLDKMVTERFMRKIHRDIWQVIEEPEEVVPAIEQSPAWDGSAIKYAPA
jgi:uncharacterized protein (TIGR00730 family)